MANIKACISVVAVVAAIACGAQSPPLVWPAVASCAGPAASDVVAQAASILTSGASDYGAQLEALAASRGTDVVVCAIDRLIKQWEAPSITAAGSAQAAADDRAHAFLTARGVRTSP